MRATQLAEVLAGPPAGVEPTLEVVTGFDEALAQGFARPSERATTALTALAGAISGTPLSDRVGDAVEKIVAGSVASEHLAVLAGARTTLLGAVHDALLDQVDAALARTRSPWPTADPANLADPTDPTSPANLANSADLVAHANRAESVAATPPQAGPVRAEALLGGCRSWLTELAIAGWHGVNHDLVSSAGQAFQAVLAEPNLRRLAVLLDGLAAELRASCPVATMERLPVRRWADLWTRAELLAQTGGWPDHPGPADLVSGRLLILGADMHEHGTAVQIQVHGVLEPTAEAPARLVRTSIAATKVDTIVGSASWRLLADHPVLLGALAGHRAIKITELPLRASGDLVWCDERACQAEPVDPFATARLWLGEAHAPAVPPLDRHPVRIAEPVLLEGYAVGGQDDGATITLTLDGASLDVDVDRLPASGPLTPALVAGSSACLGLLRWDGGRWLLQPLAVQATVKRRVVAIHNGDWALGPTDPKVVKAEAKAGDAVAVLRERAGRLLRR